MPVAMELRALLWEELGETLRGEETAPPAVPVGNFLATFCGHRPGPSMKRDREPKATKAERRQQRPLRASRNQNASKARKSSLPEFLSAFFSCPKAASLVTDPRGEAGHRVPRQLALDAALHPAGVLTSRGPGKPACGCLSLGGAAGNAMAPGLSV